MSDWNYRGAYIATGNNIYSMILEWINSEDSSGELVYKDFWKLLTNTSDEALLEDLPIGFNKKEALAEHVFLMPKNPDPENETKTYICIYEYDSDFLYNQNGAKYEMLIGVDIITHTHTSTIKEEDGGVNNRLYYLMDMLVNLIENTNIPSFNGNAILKIPFKTLVHNVDFQGYRGLFGVQNLKSEVNRCQLIGRNNV